MAKRTKSTKARRDVCEDITTRIVEALEKGAAPWRCPMDQTGSVLLPENASTGKPYQGINILNLWVTAQIDGFSSHRWMTFKQAKDAGGCVRKGSKGTTAVFYKTLEKDSDRVDDATGEPLKDYIPMLRSFTLFNLDQIDGLEHLREDAERAPCAFTPIEVGERLMNACGVPVREVGTQAFYRPSTDEITMPARDRFACSQEFYATFAHELTHATGHAKRCDRKPYETKITRGGYAFEELVAELGSLFATAHIGLPQPITNHDSYIASWLAVLKNDKRCIFKAAAQAQRACDWILGRLDEAEQKKAA